MKERIGAQEDITRVNASVQLTRRMRSAALVTQDKISPTDRYEEAQRVLKDAETLTLATAQLIIARTFKEGITEKRVVLDEIRRELGAKYSCHKPFAHVIRSTHVAQFAGELEQGKGWKTIFEEEYRGNNDIPLDQLGPTIGVIAPLSSDYHLAVVHSEYLRRHGMPHSEVKPIVVNGETNQVVLPKNEFGAPVFKDKDQIVVYIDITGTGLTGRTAWLATQVEYPDKIVHGKGRRPLQDWVVEQYPHAA